MSIPNLDPDRPVRSKSFADLFVYPVFDAGAAALELTVPANCSRIVWRIADAEGKVVGSGSAKPASGKLFHRETQIPDFHPWNVNSPYLYRMEVELSAGGKTEFCSLRFGMRKFSIDGNHFYLNNEKLFLRGVIRGREAHDHPDLLKLGLREYYAKFMRMMKLYGFNLIRFHSTVPPLECFDAADELGILIHVELRKYYGRYQKERSGMDVHGTLLDRDEWARMVRTIRNCTSLLVYCMGNEIDRPGRNPICREFYETTHRLDPTRFFLDTCARGEFDRDSVDLDVQHMSYYFPWGHSYGMFDDPSNWVIAGSAAGLPLMEHDEQETWKLVRHVPARHPVLAHEICHYAGLRDLESLDRKFSKYAPESRPWWLDALRNLVAEKGMAGQYPLMKRASDRFRMLAWKLGLEAARRSRILSGFHFLQFSDTDRYENANGILDCFDDRQGIDECEFRKFNGDTVLLADLPRRVFFGGERVRIPVIVSHFSAEIRGNYTFRFELTEASGRAVRRGELGHIDLERRGRHDLATLDLEIPETAKPAAYTLRFALLDASGRAAVENDWRVWSFPDAPGKLPATGIHLELDEVFPFARYPRLREDEGAKLWIANRFSKALLDHVASGGDAWVMYRVPVTRDRAKPARREKYYLPAVWDRFKAIIWDRGHNCGAFIRKNRALDGFPNDGFLDLQFSHLIDDADKIILDGFPVPVEPLMEGVDRAVRDRFDVYNFRLSELQPRYTMRKFAYLFELKVGRGRLLVSGFNFTGLNRNDPETVGMFESLFRYVTGGKFAPVTAITPGAFARWLLKQGRGPIVKERRMTQFWQLDNEPLESRRYWDEALKYIGEEVKETDLWMKKQDDKLKLDEKK